MSRSASTAGLYREWRVAGERIPGEWRSLDRGKQSFPGPEVTGLSLDCQARLDAAAQRGPPCPRAMTGEIEKAEVTGEPCPSGAGLGRDGDVVPGDEVGKAAPRHRQAARAPHPHRRTRCRCEALSTPRSPQRARRSMPRQYARSCLPPRLWRTRRSRGAHRRSCGWKAEDNAEHRRGQVDATECGFGLSAPRY